MFSGFSAFRKRDGKHDSVTMANGAVRLRNGWIIGVCRDKMGVRFSRIWSVLVGGEPDRHELRAGAANTNLHELTEANGESAE